ncbi:MAG: hypothetical protein ACTHNU_04065 [Gaiellales bacterium]
MTLLEHSRVRRSAVAVFALAGMILASSASTALAALQSTVDPNTCQTDGRVRAIMRVDGVVYVGGTFTNVTGCPGAGPRNNVFAFDAHTGALLSWNPNVTGGTTGVRTITAGPSGNTIFLGGDFTTVGGKPRANLAAVAACTTTCLGTVSSWSPNPNGGVFALAAEGTRLYVGGNFGNIGGSAKKNLAAVGLSSGKLVKWAGGADNEVRALLLAPSGQRIFVGGYFHHIGSSAQDHLAALTTTTGAVTPWKTHPPFAVLGLAATSSALFAGGSGGGGHLPSYRLSDGALRWQAVANGDVTQVSIYHGEVLAVGHYTTFGAQSRKHLALIDQLTGKVDLGWAPSVNSVLGTFAGLGYGQQVYAGGDFTTVNNNSQMHFAAFSDTVSDTTAPTITRAPDVRMATGTTVGSFLPVTLSWAGSDNLSGICRYTVQESIGSGAFNPATPPFPTATSMLRYVKPGLGYHFKAAAKDCSDNVSSTASGPADVISSLQNTSSSIRYAGGWTRARVSGASGGSITYTKRRGASATLKFTGRQIAWVASRSSSRGRAVVYIDGHAIKTVDLHGSGIVRRQIVFVRTFTSAGTHTIRIVNQATSGRPIVDVDAMLVLR